jgi:tRNA acetyltransferase TAN1
LELHEIIKSDAKYLLVGCEAVKERDGMSELWHVLIKYCKINPIDVFELPIRGLFLIALKNDLEKTINKIKQVIQDKTFKLKICKKFTPLNKIIASSLDNLITIISPFLSKIPEKEKWRITINRRHTSIKKHEVIKKIASHPLAPKGKVDLENPNWEIIVEIFGEWLGVSVYPAKTILSLKEIG